MLRTGLKVAKEIQLKLTVINDIFKIKIVHTKIYRPYLIGSLSSISF
jgi:hypothetical protein